MNFPDDRTENKTESERKIKNIGWGVLFAAIPIGIIVAIIGYAIDYPITPLGIFILCVPFGVLRFCVGNKTRKSKVGSVIFWVIVTLISIGLGYTYLFTGYIEGKGIYN